MAAVLFADLIERVLAEGGLPLGEAAKVVGPRVAPSTVQRWIVRGVAMPDGSRLKLPAVRVGGKLLTSRPLIIEFIQAQQPGASTAPAATSRPPAARRKASERAEAALIAAGC